MKKEKKTVRLKQRYIIVLIVAFVIFLTGFFVLLHFLYAGSDSVANVSSRLLGKQVSIGEGIKLSDIKINPYVSKGFSLKQGNILAGYSVLLNIPNPDKSVFAELIGSPKDAELLAVFDENGDFKGIESLKPKRFFNSEIQEVLKTANSKDSAYLILHVGTLYKTKNRNLLDLQRKISNACELVYAKVKGIDALYKIIPPGENSNTMIKNFLFNTKMKDSKNKVINFHNLSNSRFIIITLNSSCDTCVNNVYNLALRMDYKQIKAKTVIIVSSAENNSTNKIHNIFTGKGFDCHLVVDSNGKYIGKGKLPGYSMLIMFDKGIKRYFSGEIGALLRDNKTLRKVLSWAPYSSPPTNIRVGEDKGNLKP